MLHRITQLYLGEADFREPAICNAPCFQSFQDIGEDYKDGVGAIANSGQLFEWKTQHRTKRSLAVEVARPSVAMVVTAAASVSACDSAGLSWRDNQNSGEGGYDYAVSHLRSWKKVRKVRRRRFFASEISDIFIHWLYGIRGYAARASELSGMSEKSGAHKIGCWLHSIVRNMWVRYIWVRLYELMWACKNDHIHRWRKVVQ